MKLLDAVRMSGKEVLPLVEGGKGVSISTGRSSGAWAAAGGVGTISAVNADCYDAEGNPIPQIYRAKTRRERQGELIDYAIKGGIAQARIARELAGPKGVIHANFMWEMGGAEEVIAGILEGAPGTIDGLTCGAGMPYRLADVAARFGVHYYPIVSSGRAFNALWRRSFKNKANLLGGVVYEDPWRAGGHNGLSNTEDPLKPEEPYPRVRELRRVMNSFGLDAVPIIMAGGVWWLDDWKDWIGNPELGPVAFQFGTRPILTQESPVPDAWKRRLLTLKKGDVYLNKFSPTGFYSSAVQNAFLRDLRERSERQVPYRTAEEGAFTVPCPIGARGRHVYLKADDCAKVEKYREEGFTEALRTPDETLVFVTPGEARTILQDQANCMGCLSQCHFSNWSQKGPDYALPQRADPRSFCIQKTLQAIAHITPRTPSAEADHLVDHNLMFAGTSAWRFGTDPFYANGFIPTMKQLIDRILTGR
ncbi:nitronate monooxygenase [Formicincola oecophyllae]|uniref:Nitronate monooxygenase n=1 Tax=Formicincola oecophyllae TaxID=2558361 RepID=A0A4Y6U8G0_9PROT|nr:nitronate monooxygenase [Formicincola oecophyllae]QDH13733.1 nitronate monooxygenase [Formicincola oecophyllae]